VDQTSGDSSLKYGRAIAGGLPHLVEAALSEHPDAAIVVKAHPDVVRGEREGEVATLLSHPRVRVLAIMLPNVPSKHMMHIGNVPEGSIAEVLRWALGDIEGSRILSSERMEPES
jgi:hypothetical protein